MNQPQPQVIVATEHESVVRFYAGHVGNGGMNQTGQFTTTRPIEPTDLANMAVDLSSTFGWLEPVASATKLRALPSGQPKALPSVRRGPVVPRKNTHTGDNQLWRQMVTCPAPDCTHTARRNNMASHLQSQRHGWTKQQANDVARKLVRLDTDASPANPVGRPRITPAPAAAPPRMNKPRGVKGTQRLHSVVYPAIVELLTANGPMATTEIASALNEERNSMRKYLRRAADNGLIRDVSPPTDNANEMKVWAVPD